MERRVITTGELRVVREEGKATRVGGYAVVWESESVDLGGFVERVARNAFQSSLAKDIRAHWNHDPAIVLGRTSSGTLRLAEDDRGLAFEVDMPDTQAARDALVSIERRDVTGMSFGFSVPKGGDNWSKVAGKWLRTLLEVNLAEISIVSYPAYQSTDVGVRAAVDATEAVAALGRAQAEEQSELALALASHDARSRRLRLIGREFGLANRDAHDKASSLQRFLDSRREYREASFEKKISAIWNALWGRLGDPWPYDGPGWYILATFPDRVIVETTPGKLFSFPYTITTDNTVTLGEPTPVEVQYVALAGAA